MSAACFTFIQCHIIQPPPGTSLAYIDPVKSSLENAGSCHPLDAAVIQTFTGSVMRCVHPSLQRAVSPDSSPDRLMEEGMPESTIQVAVPSYPPEFGNEAYRIAESMEAIAPGRPTLDPADQSSASAANHYSGTGMQQPTQPQQQAHRCDRLA